MCEQKIIPKQDLIKNLKKAKKVIDDALTTGDFSKISKYTQLINDQTEKLVDKNKLPAREIINQIATTDIVIDLAFASLARQTALKILELETFLSKIEDRLFDQETITNLSNADLLNLYQTTRIMKSDSFKTLSSLKKDIDFDKLEATLLALHNKEQLKDLNDTESGKVRSILEQLLTSPEFTKSFSKQQEKKILNNNK